MASSPWKKMRTPSEDAVPGERGVFAVLLEAPVIEGPQHFAHLSWQGEKYVLRDYLNNLARKQGDDLTLSVVWTSARVRIACKGRLRRSVDDHAFWNQELRRLTDEYTTGTATARGQEAAFGGPGPRPIGLAKGRFEVPTDFFGPLPEDLLDAFHGESS